MEKSSSEILKFIPNCSTLTKRGVTVSFFCRAFVQTGVIDIKMYIHNLSFSPVTCDLSEIELLHGDSCLSIADSVFPEKTKVNMFALISYSISFKPVNNSYVHQRYELLGDFVESYRLNLSFIKDKFGASLFHEVVTFSAASDEFYRYKNDHGLEGRLVGYRLLNDVYTFALEQQEYMKLPSVGMPNLTEDREMFVQLSGDEISLESNFFTIAPYYREDRLHVFMKIMNKGPNELKITFSKILVLMHEKARNPVKNYDSDIVLVGTNGRISLVLKYDIPVIPEKFTLRLDGITTSQGVRIFIKDLMYEKEFRIEMIY